jgi:photosynthetic reaction center cytochrome c subunit
MNFRKFFAPGLLSIGLLAWIAATTAAQSPTSSPNPAQKTAGEAYKNIQVLKDVPAEQLFPAMQFISASLGVGCEHCHVRGAFEKDDKDSKKAARKMMQMMAAINQNNFEGHLEVTCYSCHHGGAKPVSIPTVQEEDTPPMMPAQDGPPPNLPSGDSLVDKYLQALGSSSDLQRLSTRTEKGKMMVLPGREFPIEASYKGSDDYASVIHMPDGNLWSGYNAHGGWQITPGRPAHDMTDAELDAAKLDSTFYFPLHIKQIFTQFKTIESDKVAGHEVYVVLARREKKLPARLYFDKDSGLLLRLLRFDETPVGRLPVQTDFSDYRDVNGIKIPFQRITARPSRRFTVKLDQIEQNVPIDDSMFEKPVTATAAAPPAAPK